MDDNDEEARLGLAKDGLARASAGGPSPGGPSPGGPSPHEGPAGGATASGLGRPDGQAPVDAILSCAAYVVLGLLGMVFGVVGSFVQNWTAGPVPVAAIVLVVLVFCMVRLAGLGMGGRLGATIPAVMWGLMAFVMSMRRAEGDLVVPGTTAGYVYIIGGMVAAVAGVMLVPPARPPGEWLIGRAARPPG